MDTHMKRFFPNGLSMKRVDIRAVILALMIVTCVTFREVTLYQLPEEIFRPYDSRFSISFPMIFLGLLMLINRKVVYRSFGLTKPLTVYFLFCIASVVFLPLNGGSFAYYLVAAVKMAVYILMYGMLSCGMSHESFEKGLDWGFRAGMIFETVMGMLAEFFGIVVPFWGNYRDWYRNGLPRMEGSFAHPSDFSLYIMMLTLYFIVRLLYKKDRWSIPFILMGCADIYLSGSRTMLLTTALLGGALVVFRFRDNMKMWLVIAACAAAGVAVFVASGAFNGLFVEDNFYKMFLVRFTHWVIGVRMLLRNPVNFLVGVGLNNHLDYFNNNYPYFADLLANSRSLSEYFARMHPIHNTYLVVATETGVTGLLVYLGMYARSLIEAVRLYRKSPALRPEAIYAVTIFAALLIYCMQDWALQKNFAMTMMVVVWAYLHHATEKGRQNG